VERKNANPVARGRYTIQLGATTAEGLLLDLFTIERKFSAGK